MAFPTNPSDVSNQMGPSLAERLNDAHVVPELDTVAWVQDAKIDYILKWTPPFEPQSYDNVGISTEGDRWTGVDYPSRDREPIPLDMFGIEGFSDSSDGSEADTSADLSAFQTLTVWGPGGRAIWNNNKSLRWEDINV